MPNQNEFTRKAAQMQVFFEDVAQQAAIETGFVQRKSKMNGARFSQTLVLGCLEKPQASLNDMAQVSADLGVTITGEGVNSRINAFAVQFLERLTQQALCHFQAQMPIELHLLKPFTKVNLVDSTIFKLPDFLESHFRGTKTSGGLASMKVQLSYDYLMGCMNAIEVQEGRSADQKSKLPLQFARVGSLTLVDLGYFDQTTFDSIDQNGAYFISRLQSQVGLYEEVDAPQSIDLLTYLRQLEADVHERDLFMGSTARVAVRLVSIALPADVVEERRRKARAAARRRGKTCSQRTLDLLAWALFVTNVPHQWLTAQQVALLYRVRWQIELVFKLWKSQAKMKMIGDWRLERVLCQFYARLLGVILFQWLSAPHRFFDNAELSLPKAFTILRRHTTLLLDAITRHWLEMPILLEKMIGDFQRFALKTKRRKSLSTYQLLVQAGA